MSACGLTDVEHVRSGDKGHEENAGGVGQNAHGDQGEVADPARQNHGTQES